MMGPEDDPLQQRGLYASEMMDSVTLEEDSPTASERGQEDAPDPLSASRLEGLVNLPVDDDLAQPPSYAEAIFTPYLAGGEAGPSNSSNGASATPSSGAAQPEYLQITCTDPQKMMEPAGGSMLPGSGSYVSYKVTTRTNLPDYKAREFAVRRRFKDFVVLADRLAESHRGYFIPPRPDKAVVEGQFIMWSNALSFLPLPSDSASVSAKVMQTKDFVEMRRQGLEQYLVRLAAHPVLRKSDELRVFLESEGKLPLLPSTDLASRMLDGAVKLPRQLFGSEQTSPAPQEAVQPAKGGSNLMRMFKELKQTVTNDWTSTKPAVVEEDKEYLERKEKEMELEKQLLNSSAKAEALTKAYQEVGEVTGELGLAFIKIAKFEETVGKSEDQAANAADCRKAGTAAVRVSRLARQATSQTVTQLGQLHEYLALMAALHTAMTDRSNALLTVQTLASDVETKKGKITKLEASASKVFGGDKSRTRKVIELQHEVEKAELSLSAAQNEYQRIKQRNREEMERFDTERHAAFQHMLAGFVRTQVAYNERTAEIWSSTAKELAAQSKSVTASIPGSRRTSIESPTVAPI